MVIIVGAGLAGLACAIRLEEEGREWLLLEASDKPGGRVATETTTEGYRLDAGFQVLLDSYPTARRLLDFDALTPRYFESGALLVDGTNWERLLNPLFHPEWSLGTLLTKSFSWREKIVLSAYIVRQLLRSDKTLSQNESGRSTMAELRHLGLDQGILERFLRPFFAGVFLDQELGTDASIFRYDLKKFASGRALLPAGGMEAIPKQLAARLPEHRQRYGARVLALSRTDHSISGVQFESGEQIPCQELVLASEEAATRQLLGLPAGRDWLSVTTLYFTGDEALYSGALLVLPSGEDRLVKHFADLTNVAPEYAPPGKRLLSATILNPSCEDPLFLASLAHAEISEILPDFASWKFLKEVRIRRALPSRAPGFEKELLPSKLSRNLFLAGDQVGRASIESALASGLQTAEMILGSH